MLQEFYIAGTDSFILFGIWIDSFDCLQEPRTQAPLRVKVLVKEFLEHWAVAPLQISDILQRPLFGERHGSEVDRSFGYLHPLNVSLRPLNKMARHHLSLAHVLHDVFLQANVRNAAESGHAEQVLLIVYMLEHFGQRQHLAKFQE